MRGQDKLHAGVGRGTEGAKDDWRSAKVVVDCVRKLGPIGLDPSSNADNSTGASRHFSGPDANGVDGLAEPWDVEPGELVYTNYPYSQALDWQHKWVSEATKGTPIVVLAPARPDTRWFRQAVPASSVVGFWRGRITFELPPGISIYKVTDPRITAAELELDPGISSAKQCKGHILVTGSIGTMEAFIGAGLEATHQSPSAAPFPSALLFYNIPEEAVAAAFGKVADLYVPLGRAK